MKWRHIGNEERWPSPMGLEWQPPSYNLICLNRIRTSEVHSLLRRRWWNHFNTFNAHFTRNVFRCSSLGLKWPCAVIKVHRTGEQVKGKCPLAIHFSQFVQLFGAIVALLCGGTGLLSCAQKAKALLNCDHLWSLARARGRPAFCLLLSAHSRMKLNVPLCPCYFVMLLSKWMRVPKGQKQGQTH